MSAGTPRSDLDATGPVSPDAPRPVLLRLRSSVLGKVLGALVVVLVVSTAVTAVVDARLTHSVVATQTRQVAVSNLRVLEETFSERQRNLVNNLRVLGGRLLVDGLVDPARRPELTARLAAEAVALGLDQLDVTGNAGEPLDPPVSVGHLSPVYPLGSPGRPFTTEPTSRLLPTLEGPFVQAVPVTLGTGPRPLVLLGGLEYGDVLAFELRRQLGGLSSVILVAGSQVAGSTLAEPVSAPPAYEGDAGRIVPPARPRLARVEDVQSLVAYVQVGRSAQDPVGGALGIALLDPSASLDRALGTRRLVAGVILAVLAVALGWLLFRALTKPLVTLAATAGRIAAGDLDRPFVPQGSDEIAILAGVLEHMRGELRAKLAVVARQAEELQESSQRIVAAQDEERRRLARDLHDGIQQELLVLRLRLGVAQESSAANPSHEAGTLADLGRELDRTIERLREVSHDLYPAILRDRGLAAAVRSYAGRLPLASTLTITPDPLPRLPPEVESGAYFLLCEAVTNALKHAGAAEVAVTMEVGAGRFRLCVVDDGKGFDADVEDRHGGLLHMEDRVRSFGGRLRIVSTPGGGTSITATFPLFENGHGTGEATAPVPASAVSATSSGAAGRTAPLPPGGSYPAPR